MPRRRIEPSLAPAADARAEYETIVARMIEELLLPIRRGRTDDASAEEERETHDDTRDRAAESKNEEPPAIALLAISHEADDHEETEDEPQKPMPRRDSRAVCGEAITLLGASPDIRRETIDAAMAGWKKVRDTGDEACELRQAAGQFAAAVWCRWAGGSLPSLGDDLRAACLDRFVAGKILPTLRKYGGSKSTARAALTR